jgi:hypothetical protein
LNRRVQKNNLEITGAIAPRAQFANKNIIGNNLYTNLRGSVQKFERKPSQKTLGLPIAKKLSKSQVRHKKLPVTPSKKPIKFHQGSKSQKPSRNRNSNVIYSTNNFLA